MAIKYKNWQSKIGEIGKIVSGIEEIEQSMNIILTTRKGENVLRPDFGCDAFLYLDRPINIARPNICREIRTAIERFEKRIKVENITVTGNTEHIFVMIKYTMTGQAGLSTPQQLGVSYGPD